MNFQTGHVTTDTLNQNCKRLSDFMALMLCALFLSSSASLFAQAQEQSPEQTAEAGQEAVVEAVEKTVFLPDSQQMAKALASPGLRQHALLDLATAASVLSGAKDVAGQDQSVLAQTYLDDRGWLNMLVERYGWVPPRSSVLDPAAWLVLKELQQQDLEIMVLVFPGRTPEAVLKYQVFHRTEQRLATANLPTLLLDVEADAINLWDRFLTLTGAPDSTDAAWKGVETAWFSDWEIADVSGAGDALPDRKAIAEVEDLPRAMSKLVLSAVEARPPDSRALVQLRYSILNEISRLGRTSNTLALEQARNSLYLVNLVDGLHESRYFEFLQGLLSITSVLLEHPQTAEGPLWLAEWLVKELPAISSHYAEDFVHVDPHLNSVMAIAFSVLKEIVAARGVEPDGYETAIKAARLELADAVAQLTLLIPDMGYYFDLPVRARIIEEVNICISIAASVDENGDRAMTRSQFDACLDSLLQLADREARQAELSGNVNGPFTAETLRRELIVTPWQRINYGIGYLHQQYSTNCLPPANALPNPLEWAVLATTMTWFAEYFPEFFHTPENEAHLTEMRGIGEQLMLDLAQQSSCIANAGAGINDPVNRSITGYELALRELDLGIKNAEAEFRAQSLRPGADVSLAGDASQKTAYRPDDLFIAPCDSAAVCEMSGNLSATRALIGLFPDEYLIAEQTGMGRIEICYRNMEWVQRRSELVRADDENVANYYGRLAFDLVGRYVEKEQVSDIFDFRFTSPEEQHYLFAEASQEILNDSCPVEWIGSRLVTPLRQNRGGIVPNRLTYLAASRKLPSRLLQSNWDRGAEWRDWFVTGIGVTALEVPPAPEITTRLNQHLQSLYQEEQANIYQRVLLPSARNLEGDDVSLFGEMSQVSMAKALVRQQMMLFYPESLFNSASIRMAVAGDAGLLDGRALRHYHEENVALTSVNGIARVRLDNLRQAWLKQPPAVRREGSIPTSLMHALTRVNILYRQFFTPLSEPLQEIEVSTPAEGQDPSQ